MVVKGQRLGIVGLQLEELRVGILEHGLVLVVPRLAGKDIIECYAIARFCQGDFPACRMQGRFRRGISIGVPHLRDEVVLHGGQQVGILCHHFVKR